MPRTDRKRLGVVLGLAVLGAAVILALCSILGDSGKVIIQGADIRQASGGQARAGQRMVFGLMIAENTGSKTATLLAASLIGDVSADQAEVDELRVMLLRPGRTDLVAAGPWPYEDYEEHSVPLEGFQLEPGEEAELLYIVSVHKTGVWNWPRSSLTYKTGYRTRTITTSIGSQVCPPEGQECPEMELP